MAPKLAQQHVSHQVAISSGKKEVTDPDMAGPGKMQLFTYYKPSLVGGTYWIDTCQSISAINAESLKEEKKSVFNHRKRPETAPDDLEFHKRLPQPFEVVAPQFSIPLDAITTHYPPDGHQDEGRVLPHIVFNDPHLPWERTVGTTDPFSDFTTLEPIVGSGGQPKMEGRESVPWLAVVTFDPEELLPTAADLNTLGIPVPQAHVGADGMLSTVPPSGAYPMTVAQYLNIKPNFRIDYSSDAQFVKLQASQEPMKAIFPTKDTFRKLFSNLEELGHLKSFAHVRNVNTTGMPDAGVDEQGLFSVIVSRRTGPVATKAADPNAKPQWLPLAGPKTQMVHLISIEHFDTTIGIDGDAAERIGLVSLFSWTYTALPPNPVNFMDSMIDLGAHTQFLTPDKAILDQISSTSAKVASSPKLVKRLQHGYVFTRWRTQSGEESVAWNRGPLVPVPVTSPPDATGAGMPHWPGSSNYGTDYQILDTDLGVMDVSTWIPRKVSLVAGRLTLSRLLISMAAWQDTCYW
jgi:hypothetical protein